jgi:hypothetical protein
MFVEDTFLVKAVYDFRRKVSLFLNVAFCLKEGFLGSLYTVPVVVAIHGIKTTSGSRDKSDANLFEVRFEVSQELRRALGRSVAAISIDMDSDFGYACVLGGPDESDQVVLVRVYAAGAQESLCVKSGIVLSDMIEKFDDRGYFVEFAVLNRLGYAHEVCVYNCSCADGRVANFTITHLAVGKSDVETGSFKQAVRVFFPDFVEKRLVSGCNGVIF